MAKRFDVDAVVEKKLVLVADVPVALVKVRSGNDDATVVDVAMKFDASTKEVKRPVPDTSILYPGVEFPNPTFPVDLTIKAFAAVGPLIFKKSPV